MVVKSLWELKKRMDEEFGSPREVIQLLSGDTGKRLDRILSMMIKLSEKGSSDTLALLRMVANLDQSGTLTKLESVLKLLPKGKDGRAMVMEVRHLATELGPKLDRLTAIAEAMLGGENK